MSSIVEYLSMGGYGSYVWSAYGFAGGMLWLNWRWTKVRRKQILKKITQIHKG